MLLFPNAKINIGLNILFKRDDGFHELESIMYPIPLTDILTININKNRSAGYSFSSTGLNVDGSPDDNLIIKAYKLLSKRYQLPFLDFHLHKSIPFGAGLGGGSADCAFTITGINTLCKLNLSTKEMEDIAASLGSDCPLFIKNKPAIAKGRGEKLTPIDLNIDNFDIIVAIPSVHISTKEAYSLVKPHIPEISLENIVNNNISEWKNNISNDFEESIFSKYPEILKIKNSLYSFGADYASLSGSGSAVFGIFNKNSNINNIAKKLLNSFRDEKLRVFHISPLNMIYKPIL